MKRRLIPVLATLAVAFSLSSCSSSPVTKFLDKLEPVMDPIIKAGDVDELSSKELKQCAKKLDELFDFVDENDKYQLTDKDREAICDWVKALFKKTGERMDRDDIKEMRDDLEDAETLDDLIYIMELDDLRKELR